MTKRLVYSNLFMQTHKETLQNVSHFLCSSRKEDQKESCEIHNRNNKALYDASLKYLESYMYVPLVFL